MLLYKSFFNLLAEDGISLSRNVCVNNCSIKIAVSSNGSIEIIVV